MAWTCRYCILGLSQAMSISHTPGNPSPVLSTGVGSTNSVRGVCAGFSYSTSARVRKCSR